LISKQNARLNNNQKIIIDEKNFYFIIACRGYCRAGAVFAEQQFR
jgi:hypothetical protein